jgi:mannitol-1-/sugar-/sorbitol-6-phosphatase
MACLRRMSTARLRSCYSRSMGSSPAPSPVVLHPRGILFDMDGVLVSSLGSVERSWEKWATSRGIDPSLAIRTAHGRRAIETVRLLRPDLNDLAELEWIEQMEVADNVGLEILAGVCPILRALPEKFWTVVTSATERLARSRMAHGGVPVPARIISAEMVAHGKPHPEPYLKGAELLGLAPADCLVIEDSASGARAGHAAGCKVLATLFSHSLESLADADWIVRSLEDVRVQVTGDALEISFTPVSREAIAAEI